MFSVFLLILSCFFFATLASLIKFLSDHIHPFEQAFFRNIISIVIILPFVIKYDLKIQNKKNIRLLFLRALFGGVTMILLFLSYSLIPLSQAMAISFTTPLFMYLGGIFFFKEKSEKINNFGILIGFLITIILIRPDLDMELGIILALAASITHATAGLLVKKISQTESILVLMFSMVCFMTPISFIPSFFVWVTPNSPHVYGWLILIALVATLGNFLWTKALSMENLTNLMPFEFSKLFFATILGILFFDEKLDYVTILCGISLLILNNFLILDVKKK